MIADDGQELHRVQVKTGTMKDGVIRFECKTTYLNHDGENEYKSYTKDEIDSYAVWSPEMGEVYCIPVEDAGDSAMTLRVSEDIERVTSQTNWTKDYKL